MHLRFHSTHGQILDHELQISLHELMEAFIQEIIPHEKPTPFEDYKRVWEKPFDQYEIRRFFVFIDNVLAGYTWFFWAADDAKNSHTVQCELLYILKPYRQKGLGKALLKFALEALQKEGFGSASLKSYENIEAGHHFVSQLEATHDLDSRVNRLVLQDVNRNYIQSALERAPMDRFILGYFDEMYPESELEARCELINVMETAPRSASREYYRIDAQYMRNYLEHLQFHGIVSWFMYVKERETQRYVGYTEIQYTRSNPTEIRQLGTGVLPEYRGFGLGSWLKAAMLDRILNERPHAEYINSDNDNVNDPMLHINVRLGFKILIQVHYWQINIARTLETLSAIK